MPMALSNGFKVFRVIISLAVLSFSTSLQVSSVPSFKIQKPVAQREMFWDNEWCLLFKSEIYWESDGGAVGRVVLFRSAAIPERFLVVLSQAQAVHTSHTFTTLYLWLRGEWSSLPVPVYTHQLESEVFHSCDQFLERNSSLKFMIFLIFLGFKLLCGLPLWVLNI